MIKRVKITIEADVAVSDECPINWQDEQAVVCAIENCSEFVPLSSILAFGVYAHSIGKNGETYHINTDNVLKILSSKT